MAKIKQLLPNFISGPLIFEWKTSPYCASTKKSSRQLWIGNALFIIFKVICVMQPDTGAQPNTFINALLSTNIRQSVDISWKLMLETNPWKKSTSEFLESEHLMLPRVIKLMLNYLCTLNVQTANFHIFFSRCKARHVSFFLSLSLSLFLNVMVNLRVSEWMNDGHCFVTSL